MSWVQIPLSLFGVLRSGSASVLGTEGRMFESYYPELKNIKFILKCMIQVGTKLRVSDNSGAKYVSCIKVLGGYKKRYARIGDKIVVSVLNLRAKRRSQTKIQKGKVAYGIVVRTKVNKTNKAHIKYAFSDNAIVLITQQGKPLASRVIGGVPKQIRYTRYMRIATLSAGIIK